MALPKWSGHMGPLEYLGTAYGGLKIHGNTLA